MSITVAFIDNSKHGPSGPITAWSWDFGDGSGTSTDQNPTYDYATAGTYSVTLEVTGTSPDGTASTTHSVDVVDPGTLVANFSSSASGLAVSFTDTSTAGPSGPITGWSWDFGDTHTSTSQNPSHTYSTGGTYTVSLTVTGTSPDGTANVSKDLTVSGTPPSTSYKPYVSTSAFNRAIPSPAPVHPLSSSWISTGNNWLLGGTANDAFKEWLGPRKRVLYWRGDTSTLPTVSMYLNWTPSGGYACGSTPVTVPMPSDFASLLNSTNVSGDHCVAIADTVTGDVWEFYHLTPPGMASRDISCSSSRWNTIALNKFKTDTTLGTGYTELSGSIHTGFASESYCHINAGMLTPEDFSNLGNTNAIPHALAFIVSDHCTSNGTSGSYPRKVSPARGGIGFNATGMPYGARLQLDPSLNIDTWTSINAKSEPWRTGLKKICKALQIYGMFIVDGSGGIGAGGINAANPTAIANHTYNGVAGWKYPWDTAGYGWSYSNGIPYDLMSHFRVIDWTKWTGI